MSAIWLFFASLTVIGSAFYSFAMKAAGDSVNPFIFTVFLTLFALAGHITALSINKIFFNPELKLSIGATGLGLALMAGIGVAVIDLAYFFAVRQGGLTITNSFWTIASLLVVIAMGVFLFQETISGLKAVGIALGFISLFLITRS